MQSLGEIELRAPAVGAKIGVFFVCHAWSACAWGQFKQVLCDGLWVDFDAVSALFQNGLVFQMHYIVLIFIARWRHNNFAKLRSKTAKSPKIVGKVCAHHFV